MTEMLDKIVAEREAAKKAGASDAELDAISREIINANRKQATGQDYANQWQPPRQLPPEPDEPEQRQMNFAPRKERPNDRF